MFFGTENITLIAKMKINSDRSVYRSWNNTEKLIHWPSASVAVYRT